LLHLEKIAEVQKPSRRRKKMRVRSNEILALVLTLIIPMGSGALAAGKDRDD